MLLADQTQHFGRLLEARARRIIHPGDRRLQAMDKGFHARYVDECIVRGYADLPGVGQPSPASLRCSVFDICTRVDDGGILAAHLECHAGEMLGSGLHDDAPDALTAGVVDVCEWLVEKCGRDRGVAFEDSHFVLR